MQSKQAYVVIWKWKFLKCSTEEAGVGRWGEGSSTAAERSYEMSPYVGVSVDPAQKFTGHLAGD